MLIYEIIVTPCYVIYYNIMVNILMCYSNSTIVNIYWHCRKLVYKIIVNGGSYRITYSVASILYIYIDRIYIYRTALNSTQVLNNIQYPTSFPRPCQERLAQPGRPRTVVSQPIIFFFFFHTFLSRSGRLFFLFFQIFLTQSSCIARPVFLVTLHVWFCTSLFNFLWFQ
jgi:hypothetical protein